MEERRDAVRAGREALITATQGPARRALAARGIAMATGMAVLAFVAPGMVVGPASADAPCDAPTGFAPRARLAGPGVVVVYRTVPATIEVGRHFTVDALVCAAAGDAVLARVDALMPEHRHGMNYRPTVAAKTPGRYLAEGLLFHMPGRWQLVFDVERAGQRTRLTSELDVQ